MYGIYYREGDQSKHMRIASNREAGIEYKIVLTPTEPADKGEYLVQDFNENKEFPVDEGEHGVCTITCRIRNAPEILQTVQIEY